MMQNLHFVIYTRPNNMATKATTDFGQAGSDGRQCALNEKNSAWLFSHVSMHAHVGQSDAR